MDWDRQRDIEAEGQRAALPDQSAVARHYIAGNGAGQLFSLGETPADWLPTTGLKFVKMKDGRHILHQAWRSLLGNVEWRPVPLEEEA